MWLIAKRERDRRRKVLAHSLRTTHSIHMTKTYIVATVDFEGALKQKAVRAASEKEAIRQTLIDDMDWSCLSKPEEQEYRYVLSCLTTLHEMYEHVANLGQDISAFEVML
jgi:hypothetical protein